MKSKKSIEKFIVCIVILAALAMFAKSSAAKAADAPVSVYVVNYPLQYFAQRIGGPDVQVTFPAPADGDPAFWKPSPEQIMAYQKADLILLNGASYAKWVSLASLPESRMVDTSMAFADQFIPINDKVTHSHGLEGKHEHGDVAFTTWLDPVQAIAQARTIRDALVRRRPNAKTDFNQRFDSLAADLTDLDEQIIAIITSGASRPLVFSHPVYQYFIRHYGLNGKQVHWEPDEAPSPEQWDALNHFLADHPAKWMVWEGTPDGGTVQALKKLEVNSLVFDPCGNIPESGDYLSVMHENIQDLKKAFGQ